MDVEKFGKLNFTWYSNAVHYKRGKHYRNRDSSPRRPCVDSIKNLLVTVAVLAMTRHSILKECFHLENQ